MKMQIQCSFYSPPNKNNIWYTRDKILVIIGSIF